MANFKIKYYSVETDAEPGQNYGTFSYSYIEIIAESKQEAAKKFNEMYGEKGTALNRIEEIIEL